MAKSLCQARASCAESSDLLNASARSRPVQTLSSFKKPASQSWREPRAVRHEKIKYPALDAPRCRFRDLPKPNVDSRIARLRSLGLLIMNYCSYVEVKLSASFMSIILTAPCTDIQNVPLSQESGRREAGWEMRGGR